MAELLERILKRNGDLCDPVFTRAAIHHLETLFNLMQKDKLTERDIYKLRIIRLFIDSVDLFPQNKSASYDMEKDDATGFLLGEMLMNSHGSVKLGTELRCKTFYQFLAVGDILVLKVNEVTDLEYKLLIIYKQSMRFKIEDLNLVAILRKTDTTIALKKDDYIKAAVQGCASDALIIMVSLDERIINDVKPIKLGKITKHEAMSINFSTVQYKYFSQYLNSCPSFKFNATKWAYLMKEFGFEPYLKPDDNEQCTRSLKNETTPHTPIHEWAKRLEIDPSDEFCRKNMAEVLLKSAKRCEEKNDLKRAIASVVAAKTLWTNDKTILYLAVLKRRFFIQLSEKLPKK